MMKKETISILLALVLGVSNISTVQAQEVNAESDPLGSFLGEMLYEEEKPAFQPVAPKVTPKKVEQKTDKKTPVKKEHTEKSNKTKPSVNQKPSSITPKDEIKSDSKKVLAPIDKNLELQQKTLPLPKQDFEFDSTPINPQENLKPIEQKTEIEIETKTKVEQSVSREELKLDTAIGNIVSVINEVKAKELANSLAVVADPNNKEVFIITPAMEGYVTGLNYGRGVKRELVDRYDILLDKQALLKGVEDGLHTQTLYTDEQIALIQAQLNKRINQSIVLEKQKQAELNKQQGELFQKSYLKSGAKKTKNGVLYKIQQKGNAARVNGNSIVTVSYVGKLLDGTIFERTDGSINVALSQLIPTWQESLPLIGEGGSIEIVVPSELAYGEAGLQNIPPNSTLIFEITLLKINNP